MKIKNKIKWLMLSIIALVLVSVPSYAEEIPYSVEYDYYNHSFTIKGNSLTDGEMITVQILKPDMTIAKDGDSAVLYRRQCTVKNGEYTFTAEYDDGADGVCKGILVSSAKDGVTPFEVLIVSESGLEEIYKEINDAAKADDYDAFVKAVNDNIKVLVSDINAEGNLTTELENYFDFVKKNELSADKSVYNTEILNTYLAFDKLNSGEMENIQDVIEKIYLEEELYSDYKDIAETAGIQKYFTEAISNKEIDDIEEFTRSFEEALILTSARYSSAYGELKEAVEKYGDSIGITGSASSAVYKKLLGKEYTTGEEFKTAYNKAVKETGSGSSGGSGGSGGSGSAGAGIASSKVMGSVVGIDREENQTEAIKAQFNDIEGVTWASEAILALADKGMINGTGDGCFKPDNNVTREEFAKILVGALGMTDYTYSRNVFSDVNESDWFCKYVNIAYENGIVKGMGDGSFGIGESITRQDMVVMLYNALVFKDAEITSAELAFGDKTEIADYAYEAVEALYGMGAVNGVSETSFEPMGTATRAQAAKIVYAVLNYLQ